MWDACGAGADMRQAVLEDYQGARLRCLTTLLADALACQPPGSPLPHDCLLLQVRGVARAGTRCRRQPLPLGDG